MNVLNKSRPRALNPAREWSAVIAGERHCSRVMLQFYPRTLVLGWERKTASQHP